MFGDLSVQKLGTHRLRFSLHELVRYVPAPGKASQWESVPDERIERLESPYATRPSIRLASKVCLVPKVGWTFLTCVVVQQKEWSGLPQSTSLSRSFADQGVRLRLRKEPRTILKP